MDGKTSSSSPFFSALIILAFMRLVKTKVIKHRNHEKHPFMTLGNLFFLNNKVHTERHNAISSRIHKLESEKSPKFPRDSVQYNFRKNMTQLRCLSATQICRKE
jgi:hypothetical protein